VCHHLPKRSLLKAARQVVHLLQHPSVAVRHSAVAFIAAVARALPPADVYAQLAVIVAGSLQQQPLLLTGGACLLTAQHWQVQIARARLARIALKLLSGC
jgi:hypothetical protein